MLRTDTGVASTKLTSATFWGNRSRISWGAVLAGAVVAVATTLLLSLLGAAIGAGPSLGEQLSIGRSGMI